MFEPRVVAIGTAIRHSRADVLDRVTQTLAVAFKDGNLRIVPCDQLFAAAKSIFKYEVVHGVVDAAMHFAFFQQTDFQRNLDGDRVLLSCTIPVSSAAPMISASPMTRI